MSEEKSEAPKLEGELKLLREEVAELKEVLKQQTELARNEAKQVEEEKRKQAEEDKKLDEERARRKAEKEKRDKQKRQEDEKASEDAAKWEKEAAKLKEELKKKREELKGKSDEALLAEMWATARKVIQLADENDWDKVYREIKERVRHLDLLHERFHLEFRIKPKKSGDYRKWASGLEAKSQGSFVTETGYIEERERVFDNATNTLRDVDLLESRAKVKGLSMDEYLKWETIVSLKEMLLDNYKTSTLMRVKSIDDSIPVVQFQAEMAETMLGVRREQAKTANILREVEKRLGKVAENTNPAQQFKLVVIASIVAGIVVGFFVDSALLVGKHEIKALFEKQPLLAILLFLVVGVILLVGLVTIALWLIEKWVLKKN